MEGVNPQEELKRLDEQIQSATEIAALKPIYYRLKEIIRAFPDDFDVQFSGNEITQRLMVRGTLLKQRETSPPPPSAAPPVTPAVQSPPPSVSFPKTVSPAPGTIPEPFMTPVATPLPLSSEIFDSGSRAQPPPEVAVPPEDLSQPPTRPAAPLRHKRKWNRALVIGPIAGLLAAFLLTFWAARQIRKLNAVKPAAMQVDIATTPPGAVVKVAVEQSAAGGSSEATCTSNCNLLLTPGTYRLSASLDGFEPAAETVTVTARQSAAISLTLQPQAQSVRLLTDLDRGKVVLDDRPPVDLLEGQLALDKVAPGAHTLKVTGQNEVASFSFEIADARLPAVVGPIAARNMIAVLVASFGKHARVVTNGGPWKLAVNGQPQSDAGPAGTDLTSFQLGVNEIVVGEGGNQRNMSESFGAAPMLTAFLKTDVNAGTLIVSTGENDVRVFVNDKEHRRRTQRGQLRIQTLGKVAVRVAKSGFQDEPAQTVEVKKGAEVRLQFNLKPQPQLGSLQIHAAVAGTEVRVDQKSVGTVGPDGSFSLSAIQPGDHTIELRREQYLPKQLQRSFHAGRTVVLAGTDVVLAAAKGTIRFTRNPASATITYRRGDETESQEARGTQIELPPGSYTFSASARGFAESTTRVRLSAGENRELDFTLARERPAAPPPAVAHGMTEFADAPNWKKDGDSWIRKGGGFVPYQLPPKGVFTFTVSLIKGGSVFRAGQIRWCLQYLDSKNYLLYEMDRKNFWAGVMSKGKRLERVKAPHHLGNQKAFTIQIEVTPGRLVHKVREGEAWKVLDNFAEPDRDFTQGQFGFLIQGNDEIAISDFKFLPK